MKCIIKDCNVDGRSMSWRTLGNEAGLDVSGRTVQRAIGTMGCHKCTACHKDWVNTATVGRRKAYAEAMLHRYPMQMD